MKSESKLERRTILDLLGQEFIIPSYQRSYRWTSTQVTALLEHIWEFSQTDEKGFYCLQPLVVTKNKENKWEVIDGQQRLTTIYIILKWFMHKHLNVESLKDEYGNDLYTLEYITRLGSADFLNNIHTGCQKNNENNIDYHYIREAYNTIQNWSKENLDIKQDRDLFLSVLLGRETDEKSVQFIWYEVPSDNNDNNLSYDLFSRLNIGKIELTNAELVKALFLRKWDNVDKSFELRQLKIASEWDNIENQLQKADFWNFIYKGNFKYITRIEYIFDILKDNIDYSAKDREDRYTFNKYYEEIYDKEHCDKEKLIDDLWGNIKTTFQIFESWYNDIELYNLIGFIVNIGIMNITTLISDFKKEDKDIFKSLLKNKISNKYPMNNIDDLTYNQNKREIRDILLLLNIASLKDQQKFRFDLFNDEKWDIEHIHSQIEKEKFNQKECREWLEMFEEFYGTNEDEVNKEISEIRENIQNFKVSKDEEIDLQKFNELYDLVYNDLKISSLNIRNDEETHNIGNLTLLDSKTNRSYKNTWFLFKRKIILQNDSLGKFIPIATKNIFTKVYSSSVTDLLAWTNSDQENYKTKMKEIINGFLEV